MFNYTILGQSLYNLCLYFIIFSFMGWLMETVLCSFEAGELINRGFVNGPFCPIYGSGMCVIITFLGEIKGNLFYIFIAGMVIASFLEYIVGMFLERVFKAKWWDYSDKPLNIHGHICAQISLAWGVLCVIMMRCILPFINNIIEKLDIVKTQVVIYAFFAVLAVDTIVTVYNLLELNRLLEELAVIKADIKEQFSNTDFYLKTEEFKEIYNSAKQEIRSKIENITLDTDFSLLSEKWKEKFELITETFYNDTKINDFSKNMAELRKKYSSKINATNSVHKRIIYAFPKLRPKRHNITFEELRDKIRGRK